jgi:hypothetical protein
MSLLVPAPHLPASSSISSGLYEIIEAMDEEFIDRVTGEHDGYPYEFAWL